MLATRLGQTPIVEQIEEVELVIQPAVNWEFSRF